MIYIFVISDFCNSTILKNNMINVFQKGRNNYSEKIQFVDNPERATHVIVLNKGISNILKKFPKENILGLAYEPNEVLSLSKKFYNNVEKIISRYHIGDKSKDSTNSFFDYYSFMWHPWTRESYLENIVFEKKEKMSIIFSEKKYFPGHNYRHQLVNKILDSDMEIHIFGRGCKKVRKDSRIKGEFKNEEPYKKYIFSIAIENTSHNSYISEKFTSCICYNTIPIYWGGKKVDSYFGENCCYKLTGEIENDIKLIRDIYENIEKSKISLEKARYELFEGKAYLMKFLNDYWVDKNSI